MKYKILHDTEYNFSTEVFPEPHYLRFRPKQTPYIDVISFDLKIDPVPEGQSEQFDVENNIIHFCWFGNMTRKISIQAISIVEVKDFNPFNFILHPGESSNLPLNYSDNFSTLLETALSEKIGKNPLYDYGQNCLKDANFETLKFITNLTKQIHSDFNLIYREEGKAWDPEKTFSLKKGSCRDLAWMQVQIFRSQGLAARFVSGYFYLNDENIQFELHAWVEIFLPGAGWIGVDPSHGIFTGNSHIPVASSVDFDNTLPVTGTTRGNSDSQLKTKLEIKVMN